MQDLKQFFAAQHFMEPFATHNYEAHQWGSKIQVATQDNFDLETAEIVIIGCGELRGEDEAHFLYSQAPDCIREEFYKLYCWHNAVKIVDAGNLLQGSSIGDTRAALRTVLYELEQAGKIVIVLGGSHDLFMQQYEAFKKAKRVINVASTDMLIDLDESELMTSRSFLMDMLTEEPNFVRHYSHIGFQSYYVQPRILEMLDKLRFDFVRVGMAKECMEDVEPSLRVSHIYSFDMNAVKYSDAPANINGSPNGFTGEEACLLARYAGMATRLSSFGIYGYSVLNDQNNITAKQIAQMIWYFIDGYQVRKNEASLDNTDEFVAFHVSFTSNDTVFLKSKRTNRWWMQMPDKSYIPCSYNDYLTACRDEMPERWLREQERLM